MVIRLMCLLMVTLILGVACFYIWSLFGARITLRVFAMHIPVMINNIDAISIS